MRSVFTTNRSYYYFIFYFSIIFNILPPFYVLPIHSLFTTSTNLAKAAVLVVFAFLIVEHVRERKVFLVHKQVQIIILVYLATQSLSVIHAVDIIDFITEYKNIIFGVITFFVTVYTIDKKNSGKFVNIFVLSAVACVVFEAVEYFSPTILNSLHDVFYDKYWPFLAYQLQRHRYFGDLLVEILIPFITYSIKRNKSLFVKTCLIILVCTIFFFSIVSNWRTKLVIFLFAIIGSSFMLYKNEKKLAIIVISLLMFVTIIATTISFQLEGINAFERLLSPSSRDISSLNSRFTYWKDAIVIGSAYPFTGVGLGNYYNYLPQQEQDLNKTGYLSGNFILIDDPHNIFFSTFAGSGYLGFISFSLVIVIFLKYDFTSLRNAHSEILTCYIISFWSLFFYAIFNPSLSFSFQFLFWFLRGAIAKISINPKVYG